MKVMEMCEMCELCEDEVRLSVLKKRMCMCASLVVEWWVDDEVINNEGHSFELLLQFRSNLRFHLRFPFPSLSSPPNPSINTNTR